jgi:PAS domain S-box-containing protein
VRTLNDSGFAIAWERVETEEAMRAALDRQPWDIVLSDYKMPRFSGLAALELLRASGLDLPFIVVSGTIGEEVAVMAMKAGAHDYVMKDKLARLAPAVQRELHEAEVRRERRRSEDSLHRSEGRLRSLVHTIPDLVWLKDTNGSFLSCNAAFERLFGASETSIIGKTDYDFVEKSLADSFRARDQAAMAAGGPTTNEEWLTFALGGYRGLFQTIKTPMHDAVGTLVGILGVARDITERNQAEEALRLQAEQLRVRNAMLERFNAVAVGRELRMVELKHEVNELCDKLGEPPRHQVAKSATPPPAEPETPA